MERVRRKKGKYKFTGKRHSVKGIISLVIGIVSVFTLLVSIQFAFHGDGSLSLYAGSIGLMAWLAGVIALVMGIAGCLNEENYKLFPGLGVVFGVLGTVLWIGIYLLGILN